MQFDVAALNLQVSPLGGGEDLLFGGCGELAGSAGHGHFLVGGGACLPALALQADAAAGGMEVDAGFLVGFVFVVGLADGEQRQAVLDGEAVVALGDEVGVLPGGDGEVFAGGEDVMFGGELDDAGRGGELEPGLRPGGDGACAALGGFDALPAPLHARLLAGRGAHHRFGLPEAVDSGELIGLRVAHQGGVLFVGDVGQATAEGSGFLCLGDRFAAVEVGATGVGSGVGTEQQAVAGA